MKQEVKTIESPSSVADDSPPQRPKRNSCQKNLGTNNGLLWREETELKKALYASLQESKRRNLEDEINEAEEKSNTAPQPPNTNAREDSPKRTKVHAQRKFAQGSAPNSPLPTPMKLNSINNPANDLLPCRRPKTEDFLTFLCLRGTTILPSSLHFLNICSKSDTSSDSRCPSPESEVLDAPPVKDVTSVKTEPKGKNSVKQDLNKNDLSGRNFACKANAFRPKDNAAKGGGDVQPCPPTSKTKELSRKRKSVENEEGDAEYVPTKCSAPKTNTAINNRARTSMKALCEKYKQKRIAADCKKSSTSVNSHNLSKKVSDSDQKMQITTRNKAKQDLRTRQTLTRSEQRLAFEKRKSLRSADSRLSKVVGQRKCVSQNKDTPWLRRAKMVPPVVDVDSESEPEVITTISAPVPKSKLQPLKKSAAEEPSLRSRHTNSVVEKLRNRRKELFSTKSEGFSHRLRERSSSQQSEKKTSFVRTKNIKSKIIKKPALKLVTLKKVKRRIVHKTMSLRNDPLISKRVTRSATKVPRELVTRRPIRSIDRSIPPKASVKPPEKKPENVENKLVVKKKIESGKKENIQTRNSKTLEKSNVLHTRSQKETNKREEVVKPKRTVPKEGKRNLRDSVEEICSKSSVSASKHVKSNLSNQTESQKTQKSKPVNEKELKRSESKTQDNQSTKETLKHVQVSKESASNVSTSKDIVKSKQISKETNKDNQISSKDSAKHTLSSSKELVKQTPNLSKEIIKNSQNFAKEIVKHTLTSSKEAVKHTSNLSKEIAKHTLNSSKEIGQHASKEIEKPVQNIPKDVPKHSPNLAKEIGKCMPKSSKELAQPALKEIGKCMPKSSKELAQPTLKEIGKCMPKSSKELAQPASKEIGKCMPKSSKELAQPASKEIGKCMPKSSKELAQPASKEIKKPVITSSKDITKHISNSPKDINKHALNSLKDITKHASNSSKEISKCMPNSSKEIAKHASKEISKCMPNSSKEIAKHASKEKDKSILNTSKDIIRSSSNSSKGFAKRTSNLSKEMIQHTSEEIDKPVQNTPKDVLNTSNNVVKHALNSTKETVKQPVNSSKGLVKSSSTSSEDTEKKSLDSVKEIVNQSPNLKEVTKRPANSLKGATKPSPNLLKETPKLTINSSKEICKKAQNLLPDTIKQTSSSPKDVSKATSNFSKDITKETTKVSEVIGNKLNSSKETHECTISSLKGNSKHETKASKDIKHTSDSLKEIVKPVLNTSKEVRKHVLKSSKEIKPTLTPSEEITQISQNLLTETVEVNSYSVQVCQHPKTPMKNIQKEAIDKQNLFKDDLIDEKQSSSKKALTEIETTNVNVCDMTNSSQINRTSCTDELQELPGNDDYVQQLIVPGKVAKDIEVKESVSVKNSNSIIEPVAESFTKTVWTVQDIQEIIKTEELELLKMNSCGLTEVPHDSSTILKTDGTSVLHMLKPASITITPQSVMTMSQNQNLLQSERIAVVHNTDNGELINAQKDQVTALSYTDSLNNILIQNVDTTNMYTSPVQVVNDAHTQSMQMELKPDDVKHVKDDEKSSGDIISKKSDKDQHKSHKDGDKKVHKSGKNVKSATKKKKSLKESQKNKKDFDLQKIKKEGESSKSKSHEKDSLKSSKKEDKESSKSSKKEDKDGSKTHKKEAEKFFSKVLKKELEREHLKSIKKDKEKLKHSWEESLSGSSKSSKRDSDRESSKSSRKESDRESSFSEKITSSKSSSSETKKEKSSKKLSPKKKKKRDLKNLEKMSKSFLFGESSSSSKYTAFKELKRRSSSEKAQLKKLLSKAKKRKKLELLKAKKLSKKLSSKLLRKYAKKKGLKLKKNKLKMKKKDTKKEGSSSKSSSQNEKSHHKTKKQKHKNKSEHHKKDSQDKSATSIKNESSEKANTSNSKVKLETVEAAIAPIINVPVNVEFPQNVTTSASVSTDAINEAAIASSYLLENMPEGVTAIDTMTSDMTQTLQGDLVFSAAEDIQSLMTSDFSGVFDEAFATGAILLTRDSITQMPLHFIPDIPPPKTMADAATNTSDDDLVENTIVATEPPKSEETSVGTQTITPAGSPLPVTETKVVRTSTEKSTVLTASCSQLSSSSIPPTLHSKIKPKLLPPPSKDSACSTTSTVSPVKRRRSSSFVSTKRNKLDHPSSSNKKAQLGNSAGLVDAPVYHPTLEEFQDPLAYIAKIQPEAEKYGICKIVPPASFKPECKVNDDMRFTAHNQYVHKMLSRWGPNVQHVACIKKHLKSQKVTLDQAPLIGGIELDLSKFYHTVQQFGGLQQVIEKKKWQRVADSIHIPKAAQDRVTKLYDAYCKYLVSYETLPADEKKKLRDEVILEHERRVKSQNVAKDNEKEDSEDGDDEENNDCVTKGRSMTLSGFYRVARNTMCMWHKNETTPEEVERQFWKVVTDRLRHVVVHAGNIDSSVYQSGFPCNRSNPFAKHPWNLKALTNNPGSILRCMGPVSGVTIPTLHVGMLFTAGCWYRDPHALPWIEYLHTGASKIWYGIPSKASGKFRDAMMKVMPEVCGTDPIWLASDTAMVPPDILVKNGAYLSRTIQNSGQFIVIFPESYTSTICSGYCVSESVYFATTSWLDLAERTFKDIRDSCEPPSFSLDRLLFCIANDSRTSLETLQKILPMIENIRNEELRLRKILSDAGLKSSERLPLLEVRDKKKKSRGVEDESEQECEICRTHCYVSMVVNTQEDSIYCLQHAIEHIPKKDLKSCKLAYTYDKEELLELVKRTEGMITVLLRDAARKKTPKKRIPREK